MAVHDWIRFKFSIYFKFIVFLAIFTSFLLLEYDKLSWWLRFESADCALPVIIWWNRRLFPHWNTHEWTISCKSGKCLSTQNYDLRKNSSNSTMLLFYGSDLDVYKLPIPRLKYHQWALIHEESPLNNYVLSHGEMIELFNYTATFRRESDYPLTTLYLPGLSYLMKRKPVPLNRKNALRKSLAPVLYVQSNCNVPSNRDEYVSELAKYLPIDSYGKCLNNRTLPDHLQDPATNFQSERFLDFIAEYKFHLAFENALCNDYVTEKLFRAFHVGSVPIYYGGAAPSTISDWIPSDKSVILVDDFESPKHLAEFVLSVDANDTKYSAYLSFKRNLTNQFLIDQLSTRDYGVNDDLTKPDFIRGFECFLCDMLWEQKAFGNTRTKMANNSHLGCPAPISPTSAFPKTKHRGIDWVNEYWNNKKLAVAVKMMVESYEKNTSDFHPLVVDISKDEL